MNSEIDFQTTESVQNYYGEVLKSTKDLKTSACCSAEAMPLYVRNIMKQIHPEVLDRFYGCGSPFPPAVEGLSVLDLGCGTGRDVFLLSKLVGPNGKVIGVDMTDEQLEVAHRYLDYHTKAFAYAKPNIEFKKGYIEALGDAGIESNSMDLVVSNCVTNLSPNKAKLFSEIWRVLKPGGELYFSDVFADKRIAKEHTTDPVLLGECLGGAMYTEDFRRLMYNIGCKDFRVLSKSKIELHNEEVVAKVGDVNFYSITFRAFKMDLEDRCEDYGQVAYYQGSIENFPHSFTLDDHHTFVAHKPMLVCGNTADMLSKSKYAKHFKILGEKTKHFGLFDCAPVAGNTDAAAGACC